ncbi:hypothetical protein BH24CHL4_BH24CHL4_12250 [soil metagenome]
MGTVSTLPDSPVVNMPELTYLLEVCLAHHFRSQDTGSVVEISAISSQRRFASSQSVGPEP